MFSSLNAISSMQITWPWPPVDILYHDLITLDTGRREHKVVRLVWEFDCLHFAKYISNIPHDINCKQTWCEKIYCMDSQLIETLEFDHLNYSTYRSEVWSILFQNQLAVWICFQLLSFLANCMHYMSVLSLQKCSTLHTSFTLFHFFSHK